MPCSDMKEPHKVNSALGGGQSCEGSEPSTPHHPVLSREDTAMGRSPLMRKSTARVLLVGAFVFLVVVQVIYLVHIGNGLGRLCDPHSEADALRSGEAYWKDGLTSYHGLPRILYGSRFLTNGTVVDHLDTNGLVKPVFRMGFPDRLAECDTWVYTHYPPGPNLLCGVSARLFGFDPIWKLRLLPVSLSLTAVAVFFWMLARVFGTGRAGLIAMACAVLPMVSTHMPALHYEGYSFALLLLQFSLLLHLFWKSASLRLWHLPVFFLFGFLQGWLSFDQFFVVGLLPAPLWLLRRAEGARPSARWLVLTVGLLVAGFVLAHVLHFLQVGAELGGLQQAFEEFRRTAGERAGKTGGVVMPKLLLRILGPIDNHFGYFGSLALGGYYYLREILLLRGLQFGPFMLLAILAALPVTTFRTTQIAGVTSGRQLWASRWLRWPGPQSVLPALGAALLVSLLWMLVMPAHVVGNHHITVRHLFVFYFCLILVLAKSVSFRRESETKRPDAGADEANAACPNGI
jgi:hypothetical protein